MAARGMYPPRQQGPMGGNPGAGNGGMDGGPGGPQHGSAEWRHMMMQQGNNFGNQMRPNFAQHQGANKRKQWLIIIDINKNNIFIFHSWF